MTAVALDIDFTALTCWVCGVSFAMPRTMERKRSENGKSFWCPNGCQLSYGEGEIGRLKKELERKQKEKEWADKGRDNAIKREDKALRRVSAMKGVVTRTKNRIGKGVCPCCNRTFANVAKHMESKHPTYAASDPESG